MLNLGVERPITQRDFSVVKMSYKWWLLMAAGLFGLGLVLGLATPLSSTGFSLRDIAGLEEFAELLAPLAPSSVLTVILVKNVSALLISFALSPLFCLIPVMALVFNGWLLGLVATTVVEEKSLGYLLAGLLPHGILELPALIIGEAVALSFGTTVLLALFQKGRRHRLRDSFRQNWRYLSVALLLLVPAALIETYVTPWLLGR